MNKTSVIIILLAFLSGCSPTNISVQSAESSDVQLTENSSDTKSYTDIVHMNNCGGTGDSEQTEARSFSTSIEGTAELKVDFGNVEGLLSAKYGQYRNTTKSLKLIAPPGKNMEFAVKWTEQNLLGSIIANGKSGSYGVHVPMSVELVSSNELACDSSRAITSTPTFVPSTPVPAVKTIAPRPTVIDQGTASQPVFVYPVNGQQIGYVGAYIFKVEPVAKADGYLWGFFQNNVLIWENWRDEGTLSGTEYAIGIGSVAHGKFSLGTMQVMVRAQINGQWTDANTIEIHLIK